MSATIRGVGSIRGGLPVVADVRCGYDSMCGEHWAEVQNIYWLRSGDRPGKEIPRHLWEKAEKYDPWFCNLIDQVNEYVAHEQGNRRHQGFSDAFSITWGQGNQGFDTSESP
jgi:hypothetical protein